ncbi:hypothetical protein L3Q67_07765 [Saccharothrix sp. AJ9571]|nr:hypothetical protein L3Q67_07765 [Saccharothrix sp. AJ9571]
MTETTETVLRKQTRTELAVQWTVWHFGELSAVSVPLLLGLTVNGWIALLSVPAAAVWAVFEVRAMRRMPPKRPAQIENTATEDKTGTEASA